ncbi:lysozyme inhibitor LprI family protein [Microvirga mediterraneensis]|uniref:DUF1311 domain-containing protein n=1 Tax=Microvirga mediterraneensis TaxID=2754695 RepID=A0A838BRR9_9HYPH|nr:lysozyme inhibitor LprI family protein [Microvirga mediterraneensis]MBA1157136.1 DUF1311 domain-containing protein [Microvirga mediterraneensis]
MKRNSFCLAVLALLLFAGRQPAEAASFDCAKAETLDEKAVCADPALNDQDVEMSVLYTQLKPLLGMGARGDMEDAQVAWLKQRETCGGDRACLGKAYDERVLQLRSGFDALAKRGPF